ncbi:CDP-diacylglycerol--inositol 3-phosphatidyltransferase [Nematocida minor]|uniref:CDP-diacylglycerol--inositol 3-phosphatidyltransferase n=1 Tax=Nematocida minor TaxID=1912983 RepID=UPI00221FE2AB|nr:CDP-diacylglycerol--inositol 3-phosphatidyltransferase [Nematocida minor]KAI5191928.1 CDP-diacylglycerol--inositol 3-phosphatidyltransferase [Nematocida minor]
MQKDSKNTQKRNTALFIPNIIGYFRLAFLFISIFNSTPVFVGLYSISYILDALDGFAARCFRQESELGYILDMAVDRAASSVLTLRVVSKYPHLFPVLAPCLVLDLVAHMFCIVSRCVNKTSHKSHSETGFIDKVLSLYYTKAILFITCFGAEVFFLNILYFHNAYLLLISGAIFSFKQLTNVLQFQKALCALSAGA